MVWHAHRWNPARDPTSKERKSKKKRRENSVWLLVLRKRLLFVNQWYAFAFVNYYGLDISIIITVWSPLFFTWCPAPPILVCSHSVWSRTGVYCTFPFHSWLKWTAVMLRTGAPSCYHEIFEKKTRWCFFLSYAGFPSHDWAVRRFLRSALEKRSRKWSAKDVSRSTVNWCVCVFQMSNPSGQN